MRAGLIERDPDDKQRLRPVAPLGRLEALAQGRQSSLVDRMHLFLGMAHAGQDVAPVLTVYPGWETLAEGLRYLGKRESTLRELCELVSRAIDAMGPERKKLGSQLSLPV